MSFSQTLASFLQKMQAFTTELRNRLANKTTNVASVADADRLNGATAEEMIAILKGKVAEHIAKTGMNVHGLLPSDLGTYTAAQFQSSLDSLLNKDGNAPLSFYGDREYLPPSVTGSFESGVNWLPWGQTALFLEDNGTLMLLRSGTDGVKAGVYYSYLRNALTTGTLSDVVMTNTRYHPAYFPAGQVAVAVLWGNQDLIIGVLANATTMAHTGYFISLTNNTFDQTKHTGIVIPTGGVINAFIANNAIIRGMPIAFLKDNTVYLLTHRDADNANYAGWKVYSIAKSQLINSVYTGATPITNWTINRGSEGTVVREHLDFADNKHDLLSLGSGMTPADLPLSNDGHTAKTLDDGSMWLLTSKFLRVLDDSNLINYTSFQAHFSFAFNPTTKAVDVARYFNSKPVVAFNAGHTAWTVSTAPATAYLGNSLNHALSTRGQVSYRLFVTDNNRVFYYNSLVLRTNRTLGRATYPSSATFDEMVRGAVQASQHIAEAFEGRFASPVSYMFSATANLGDRVIIGRNPGWTDANKVAVRWFRAETNDSNFSYQYGSLQGLNFMGLPPTENRYWLDDLPGNVKVANNLVNETDSLGWRVHQARYGSLYATRSLSGYSSIDADCNGTGTVSIEQGAFENLADQIKAHFLTQGLGVYSGSSAPLWYEVIVPQRYTDLPAFVHGHFVDQNRVTWYFIYSLTINSRSATTSATLVTASQAKIKGFSGSGTSLNVGAGNGDPGQIAIRRVTGGFVLGIVTYDRFSYVGNSISTVAILNWTPSGGWAFAGNAIDFDQQVISITNFVNTSSGMRMTFVTEAHRMFLDAGTKLIGVPVATTALASTPPTTLRNRFTDVNYAKIFLSQQTITAWSVYFSDPTAAMVDGLYAELPITTMTLDSGTDANKTFYVWIVKQNGVLSYYRTTNSAVPTGFEAVLYIGTFTTNSQGLATVNISKRVAVGGMLLSPVSAGRSIPLTSGVPMTAGRLNWR